ncbi:MAG: pyridoxamine 5'-phosphate oxidase family protein [Solirubrobacterales bacterium]
MTSSLPQEVQEAFDRFITCEFTTIDAAGQPIVWPVTPYYEPGGPSIDVTTGIGYPKKADDAKRHPSVSLLFSDPTGSGTDSGIAVLVQGTAEVDEEDLNANRDRYWRESAEKLPGTKDMHPPKPLRGLLGWYYARIYVHVRPERVFVWPDGDVTAEPQVHDSHLEEVRSSNPESALFRSGGSPPRLVSADAGVAPDAGIEEPVWDTRIDELGQRYETAVLSWPAPDGFPLSVRVPVRTEPSARRIRILAQPGGLPLGPGPACLVAHRHHPDFKWQENFQVRGELVQDPGGWALVPRKLVGGFELPEEGALAGLRRNFGKARRFRRIYKQRLKDR